MERPVNRLNNNKGASPLVKSATSAQPASEEFYRTLRSDIISNGERAMHRQRQEDASREKCPTCGQTRLDAQNTMELDREVTNWIRNSNSTQLDSCILCVEKHIGRAMVAYDELCSSDNSGTASGDAAINPYKARILVIGHLGHAIEESYEYTELHSLLQSDERAFRYSCKAPQWAKIVKLIEEEKKNQGQGIKPVEEAEKQQP